ncbi:MAG: SAM-dependent methyltransferase, partial [Dehalococcoidia bacterium]|nr:SAM-dependent methyltransferase [Dehalococcoidia bacterium]
PVPGASAVTAALAVSGLPTRRFHYLGFLPRVAGDRRRLLSAVANETDTLLVFEAPHRLRAALVDIQRLLRDRRVAVCRELTKLHEEVFRGTVSEALGYFAQPRGEFTLVIEGAGKSKPEPDIDVDDLLRDLRRQGLRARDAVKEAAQRSSLPRKDVYRRWLALEKAATGRSSVS